MKLTMLESLINYSFFIIALAFSGFIIKDMFYTYRKWTMPYEIKSNTDRFFSYISLTIAIFALIWIIAYQLIEQANTLLINVFGEALAVTLTGLALFYFFIYLVIMSLGVISCHVDIDAILVTFTSDSEKRPSFYKRIITESDDFLYFESKENFRHWTAIRKEEIKQIERIFTKSWLDSFIIKTVDSHKKLSFLRNKYVIFVTPIILLVVVFFLLVYSSFFINNELIITLIIIILVPSIILFIIGNSLQKDFDS